MEISTTFTKSNKESTKLFKTNLISFQKKIKDSMQRMSFFLQKNSINYFIQISRFQEAGGERKIYFKTNCQKNLSRSILLIRGRNSAFSYRNSIEKSMRRKFCYNPIFPIWQLSKRSYPIW